MTTIEIQKKAKINARTAGILYLIIIITGLFSEMFVRSGIIISGDAMGTITNIAENESLYRFGIASDLIMVLSDVVLGLLFYLLLKPVNQGIALLAAFFRLAQDAIIGLNLLNFIMPLQALDQSETMIGLSSAQLNSLVMLSFNAHANGYLISGAFFGLSCIFLGYLVYKSSYFPKWLGVIGVATGMGYFIDVFTNILAPDFASASEIVLITVAITSELSFSLFLLIRGVNSASKG